MRKAIVFLAFFGIMVTTGFYLTNMQDNTVSLANVRLISMPHDVQRIVRTSNDSGWACTSQSFLRWKIENDTTTFTTELKLGTNINYFVVNEPIIYLCTNTNVYSYHTETKLFTSLLGKVGHSEHPVRSKQVSTMLYSKNRRLSCTTLALSQDKKYLYVGDEYKFESFIWKLDLRPSQCLLPVARGFYNIRHILETPYGLWIAEITSLSKIKNVSIETKTFAGVITDMAYNNHTVWISTYDRLRRTRIVGFQDKNTSKLYDFRFTHSQLVSPTMYVNKSSSVCLTGTKATVCPLD